MSSQVQLWRVSLPASDGDAALSGRAPPASAARLTNLTCDIYQLCLKSLAKRLSKPLYRKVERPYGYLRLWADGYGVYSGELDRVLADSTRLRHSTVRLLVSLCRTLTNHLVSFVGEAAEAGLLHQLSTQAKDLLETTAYSIHNGESSDSESDSDSDSAPSFGELSIKEIAADLETDVQCLVDLKLRYEEPVRDRPPVEKEARPPEENTTWNPAEYLASRIRHRYPDGQSDLVAILGRNNWDRMLRLAKAREQKAQQPVEGNKEQKAATSVSRSEFHDSGLGTSIATPSSYAETVVSYHGSKGGSIKIPPLPAEAAGDKPFICGVCGDSIKISNTTLWKRHLLQDLRPYTCLVSSCKFGLTALLDKRMWTEHLKLEHGFPGSMEGLACPFCQQATGTDESAFFAHLGRHLEEISLMILHTNTDDDEMEDSSDEESPPRSLLGEAPKAKPLDDDYNSPLGDSEPRAQQALQPGQQSIQQNSSQQHTVTNEPEILIPSIGDETVLDTDVGSEPAPGSGEVDTLDEIKLHGGLSVNGLPAELVRVTKDGKAFSISTGDPVELHEEIKASVSTPARSASLLSRMDAFDFTTPLQLPTSPSKESVGRPPVPLFTQPLEQEHTTLYSPISLREFDEGFEDFPGGVDTANPEYFPNPEFVLFPPTSPLAYSAWEDGGAEDGTSLSGEAP